jgi:ABC-type sugar transport system ATPase subunit
MCIMHEGRVVQVGAPLEVYRNPVNTFVAGFLASPPMNLLDARVEGTEGALEVALDGLKLPVPANLQGASAPYRDQPVVFGIRPEDLYSEAGPGRVPVPVRVVTVEALGPEVVLVASLPDGREVSARLERTYAAAIGSAQHLHADLEMTHLFDPATGQAITGS